MAATGPDREKALGLALAQIDKQFGKGSVMRLGERPTTPMAVIPTGSIALDIALGIGGLPRGRVVEIYGPESSGKCMTADTYLWTDRGLETVAELFARCGQPVSCTNRITDVAELGVRMVNERGQLESVAALTHNNRRPVLTLTLRSGRTISATRNHPLRVMDERGCIVWRNVDQIGPGDVIVSGAFGAVESCGGDDGLSEDEAVLLGYLVAGGGLSHDTLVRDSHRQTGEICANADPEANDEFCTLMKRIFDVDVHTYRGMAPLVHDASLRTRLAEGYGLDCVTASGVSVPYRVRTGGDKIQRAFLSALFESALFEGDGGIDSTSTIGLDTASEQVAREVQLMLYGLGIPATLTSTHNESNQSVSWIVTVAPAVMGRFVQEVGFRSARRHSQVERNVLRNVRDPWVDTVPDHHGYTYEDVIAVADGGDRPTFDVMLPGTHSFLANGMLSHNTTVALHAIANAQRTGGIAAFIDAEHALDPDYARALGVDTDALLVSQPDTGEQALEITDMLVRSGALDIVVIDSVAALVPRAEIEGEMGDSHVGLQARLMSQALRKITGALNTSNTTAIFINQLREKIGILFGSPETTTGGRALKFYSSVRLDVRRVETLKDSAEAVGNRTRVKVVKNKLSAPFKQAEFDILYGKGISREGSLIDVGVEQGIVRKSGAWYTYEGDQLGQGKENARKFLLEHSDVAVEIEKRILEKLGVGQGMDVAGGADLPPVDF
jgi:protein RecA